MKKKRMSPYELEESIFEAVEGRRWATRQTWREVHKEALLLWIEKHKDVASLIPARAESGESYAHAPNVESVSNPGSVESAAVVPAAGVPAAGVPAVVSENEKRLGHLITGRALKQAFLERMRAILATNPEDMRALRLAPLMENEVADYDRLIAEVGALVDAEKLAKENTGEVVPGEEV